MPAVAQNPSAAHKAAPASPPLKTPNVIVTLQSHPVRPLSLKHRGTELQILIPHEMYTFAEGVKEELNSTLALLDASNGTDDASSPAEAATDDAAAGMSEMELFSRYLSIVQMKAADGLINTASGLSEPNAPSSNPYLPLLLNLFQTYYARFCSRNSLHSVIAHLPSETRELILSLYFSTLATLKENSLINPTDFKPPKPALFALAEHKPRPDAAVFPVFGGQGNTTTYINELLSIKKAYHPIINDYISTCSSHLVQLAHRSNVGGIYSKGLNVQTWLESMLAEKHEEVPQQDYFLSAPVSLPLVGLVQLCWYFILIESCEQGFEAAQKWFKGTTGHSQGIISSVVIASSNTKELFIHNSLKALSLLFYIGARSHQVFPPTTLNPKITIDSLENNEGTPSPMCAISSLPVDQIQKYIDATNKHLPKDRQVQISLINGPRNVVVSGHPQSLYGLNVLLRKLKNDGGNESRVPHSQRKVKFSSRFLPVSVPFHSPHLVKAVDLIKEDILRDGLEFKKEDISFPVYATDNGSNLQSCSREDISVYLTEQICTYPVLWEKATASRPITHIIDFGPGSVSGIGALTQRNKEGTGVQVILADVFETSSNELLGRSVLFDVNMNSIRFSPNWARDYCPKLVKTSCNGNIYIDTKFSRLLGKPPLMVAGMTPCTVSEKFVSAVINAGYHIEVAGGGHYNEAALRKKVNMIMQKVDPGEGITLNILFLNARQWGFQYPLVQVMRREGYPMEGVCVAAGVPSLDVANEIIKNLKEAGIRHVSFKPGSVETIRQVCTIASRNPDMPIILQWTGGRAGGHHSYEDFHAPLLETYGFIRRHANIILVGGSGFGDTEGTLPYLTGDWSVKFNYPPMPLDGLLFGSRVMVSKEGLASTSAKELIVKAPGLDDEKKWEQTYKKPTGGVVTVTSELGEPIHKIATRGVMLWKELDETVFSLPKEKRIKVIREKKHYIIERLNKDFQKVWFGKKSDGSAADLNEMTYSEVAKRLVELLYINKLSMWIDRSYMQIVSDFLGRIEERFCKQEKSAILQSVKDLEKPNEFLPKFLENYPEASAQLLTTEDVFYFISICQMRGRKPVTFIPVLDENFSLWFKKDSLWQSEFIEAVVDEDPQRVCILHGPVAAKFSNKPNEPVKEILDNIYDGLKHEIMGRYYQGNPELIPKLEFFGGSQIRYSGEPLKDVSIVTSDDTKLLNLGSSKSIPALDDWLELLSGPVFNWVRALLMSSYVAQGHRFVDNPMKKLFKPRANQTVRVQYDNEQNVMSLSVFDGTLKEQNKNYLDLESSVDAKITGDLISVVVNERRSQKVIPLQLFFKYQPEKGYCTIHEVMEDRNDRIKDFYARLWFSDAQIKELATLKHEANAESTFKSKHVIQGNEISQFCQVVGNHSETYISTDPSKVRAPMDFAIVVGWKALVSTLFMKFVNGDLLKLVHLSNNFRVLNSSKSLKTGDECATESEILCIRNTDSGKQIDVKAVVSCQSEPLIEIQSSFLIRGSFDDFCNTFEKVNETPMQVNLKSVKDIEILKSKDWIQWSENGQSRLFPGCSLTFRLKTYAEFNSGKVYSLVRTSGSVTMQIDTKEIIQIATVNYDNTSGIQYGNPVTAYLKRFGKPIEQPIPLENGGYMINTAGGDGSNFQTPPKNDAYSAVSGDYNPIHVNPYFADYASLPGTITHGMWTSAATRKFVEIFAADNQPSRVISYHADFRDMVLPGDLLETKLYHIGMQNGRKLVRIETINQNGVKVLEGKAEVEQPRTAYIFTGQGSQEVGMGMELYKSSAVAKNIWDRADRHFQTNYGFSILEIVRENPKSKTIYFGGKTGQAIRQNYLGMTCDVVEPSTGNVKSVPLFPEITQDTYHYTFKAPNGLLSATQFTQPALTLVEIAGFEDMRSKGIIQENSAFAGHSLGEYAALASVADVLPVESLADIVFYRGMTMQHAVPRDSDNRSNYGMSAVNPSRVSSTFDQRALSFVIDLIRKHAKENEDVKKPVIEIVNYNVENYQYVVAGDLVSLDVLSTVLNAIKVMKVDIQELLKTMSTESVAEHLSDMIKMSLNNVLEKRKKSGFVALERGYATLPLPGIDVPFHSSFLLPGVTPFRNYLTKKIQAEYIDVSLLTMQYIPNLTAIPFEVSFEYIKMVYEKTRSFKLKECLTKWEKNPPSNAESLQVYGHTLMIELLSYQFASAVQWIETQDVLFRDFQVERMIEVGPSPTLVGMANRTLKLKYSDFDDALTYRRSNLCYSRDTKEIYYQVDEAPEPSNTTAEKSESATTGPVATPAPTATPVAVAAAAPVPRSEAIEDVPVAAVDILHAIIAQKVKRSLSEIPLSKSIKDISGGKSTLQNEILGDLQNEFGSSSLPEKGEELSLEELGSTIAHTHNGSLGKHTSGLVAKMISSKMPGGFGASAVKGYLTSMYGLGPQRSDGVLLLGTTMEPAARLGSESDAKTFLDSIAKAYASKHGIDLSSPAATSQAGATAAMAINSEEFNQLVAKQDVLLKTQLEAFARYLGTDLLEGNRLYDSQKDAALELQQQLDLWFAEHGEFYAQGIKPRFSPLKARKFDSYWNWVRCDIVNLYYDIVFGKLKDVDRALVAKCLHVMNRSNDTLIDMMKYWLEQSPESKGETYKLVRKLGQELMQKCAEVSNASPVYKVVDYPTAPKTTVTEDGVINYAEVHREGIRNISAYVKEMCNGSSLMQVPAKSEALRHLEELYKSVSANKDNLPSMYTELSKYISRTEFIGTGEGLKKNTIPFLHLKKRSAVDPSAWEFDSELTQKYLNSLSSIAENGLSLSGKMVLLTGCGKESIGSEILKALLSAGAKVIVTTSRFSKEVTEYYRHIYEEHGSKDSCVIVVPFNQASQTDLKNLIDYIYNKGKDGLGWDLDCIIPFAAISENGREITDIDGKSELAHRIMLTNVIRLLGIVADKKKELNNYSRPAQVILPLSPNHGTFGGDGLYGESKISLETLLNRWYSESWGQFLTICGAVIGWTRGTGLMSANNVISEGVENMGVRTFSTVEMAFNLVGLMHPKISDLSQFETLWVDLAGGMNCIPNLNTLVSSLRKDIIESAEISRAVTGDRRLDIEVVRGPGIHYEKPKMVTPRANMKLEFPILRTAEELKELGNMKGMVDLEKVVVVTGYGEVGPYGNARTRWEMEANGKFSLEGCIEMAWMMGMIKFHRGTLKTGQPYSGWVDSATGEPVKDIDVKAKYEKKILEHTGVRLIEGELFEGYNPRQKTIMQEVVIDQDMESFEVSKEEANAFKMEHGEFVDVQELESGEWSVRLRKGATLFVPKALRFDRLVAGQIPTGWDAARYGVPKDIVEQVDPITLFVLVSTVEAFVNSGITDPYEFYQYMHVTDVGNTSGSGVGGMVSNRKIYKDRLTDKPVQNDILQESFINTMPAWVNLLLLSSSGPIKTPVGACATAVESVEIGYETIISGKAKVVIVGGYDDFQEEGSYEFANMKATSNAVEEMKCGREPKEMSRPCTSTRGGFMESQGSGIEILMSAKVALEMGVPIYAIVALTNTATDKAGRSVPAPGQGILTTARECPSKFPSPLLDMNYRRRQIERQRKQIKQWVEDELEQLKEEAEQMRKISSPEDVKLYIQEKTEFIEHEAHQQEKSVLANWGNEFYKHDKKIAPLRGALAVWGLTIDDISVASFHGTGTKANDINESEVLNKQFVHLGRTPGNVCVGIFQKYLTGHPKGAAAGFMFNGVLQVMATGIIPGNRNADNIDEKLKKFEYILYPSRSIRTNGVKAAVLKSFGFGQVGGEIVVIHPDYLYTAIDESEYANYIAKREVRQSKAYRYLHDSMTGIQEFVSVKSSPPYTSKDESLVYLDPTARASFNPSTNSWSFDMSHPREQPQIDIEVTKDMVESLGVSDNNRGVGVDVELVSSINMENETFIKRNFTLSEIKYCQGKPDPQSSFAGKWAAKEAVIKSVSSFNLAQPNVWKGAGAPMNEIEIVMSSSGAPSVVLHGEAKAAAAKVGVKNLKLTISHSGSYAVAFCSAF